MKTIEQNFVDWEAHVFGFGYGTGEPHTLGALKSFMYAVGREDHAHAYDYTKLETAVGAVPAWLLLNILCHADIIDYGSSPRFGWLTSRGERLKDFLATKSVEELVALCCAGAPGRCKGSSGVRSIHVGDQSGRCQTRNTAGD